MSNRIIEVILRSLDDEDIQINPMTLLSDIGWDSMSVMLFISEVEDEFGKVIDVENIDRAVKVQDLIDLVS